MKFLIPAFCAVIALGSGLALAAPWRPPLEAPWRPSSGHTQLQIWPGAAPDAQPAPGPETKGLGSAVAGKLYTWVSNVTQPTMTVYAPAGKNTGAAVVVLPGGGFQALAIDLEGTEVCDWLTSRGITCVLLKYRVPSEPYDWRCDCRPVSGLATSTRSLEDTQRTIGLVRLHAKEWRLDPQKVGVMGFSAGGYLAAEISTKFQRRLYAPVDEADRESARPDFAVLVYPGHLTLGKVVTDSNRLNPDLPVSSGAPPTFLLQAENDDTDGVDQALVYYAALTKAGVPAEMHLYAQGGHAFGLRRTRFPITDWPRLVEVWLRTIGMTPG
jgi:acetyl esterase/lipase